MILRRYQMRHRFLVSLGALLVALAVGGAARVAGQSPAPKTAAKPYAPPRTAIGQPDLQGVWANNMATPLQRPKELADKPVLTDQELTALKTKAAKLFASGGGDAVFGDGLYAAVLAASDTFVSTDGKT